MHSSSIGRIALLILAMLSFSLVLSAQSREISLSSLATQTQLLNNHDHGFEVRYRIGQLTAEEVITRGGSYDELSIEGYGYTGELGEPKLPMQRQLIAVPLGADLRYSIISSNSRRLGANEFELRHPIIPAQESVSKSADPSMVEFVVKHEVYQSDRFTEREPIQVREIGFMRGLRLFELEFYPVNYNPVRAELNVIDELQVRIEFINPDLPGTAELLAKTASFEYDRFYQKTVFNWQRDDRPSLVRYPTKMLILCPPSYVSTLQPFVDWKKQQGYNVIVTTVGSGGTVSNSTSAIKSYMQGLWNSATAEDPAPTYLLIVGDTSTSGNNIIANTGESSTSHVTDLTYVRLNGTDYLPEMYYGRFSVSSATELTNIVNKSITFEKTLMPDLSYLGNVVMIAGVDSGYAPTYGNGQINYGTTHYFNSSNGLTSNTYLYPASGSSDAAIIANANAGRGYMNYTAHGSETSWADPTFSVSDVNSMTNTNKYGVMVGNCCITNKFNYTGGPCFGEAIIRKADAGGVVYIGATNNSYWDEDYWWGIGYKTPIQATPHAYSASTLGAYDAMFHTHNEAFTDWGTTVGEINYMGNTAVQQSSSSRKPYYWEIYSIMGDPSLMPYLKVPTVNTATFPSTILIGSTSINLTATPYSRVALTMGGTNYGTDIVPASGNLTLPITPFASTGTATLVITAPNKITRIESITIAPNSGPYVNVTAANYSDSNNNLPEYNETGRISPVFQNVGSAAATNLSAILTCSTPGITITDGNHSITSLAAGASSTATNAYSFAIANNVVDGTVAQFTITTTMSGQSPWVYNFSLNLNAPTLDFGNLIIQDSAGNNNGRLDPGETVTLIMPLANNGNATSPGGTTILTCSSPGITINTGTANFSAVSASGGTSLSFGISVASSVSIGSIASLVFNATAGSYTANTTENIVVGIIMEDFETGNFGSFDWVQGGNLPWTVINIDAHTGTYSAKSGAITHNQSSTIETTRVLSSPGEISFWYKVSSESGYDYLKFYVDGVQQARWAGTVDWTQVSYNLAAGTRVLKWEYMKDGSVSSGSDCAWLDDIIFPASNSSSTYNPPQNLSASPGNGYVNLSWQAPASGSPTGYKIFRNSNLLTTTTGLSYMDNTVVNESTYSYYLTAVYSGGESDPTDSVQATPTAIAVTEVVIGSGTSSTSNTAACPINVYYQSLHGQSIYTAAELNAAGVFGPIDITQIGFNVVGLPALAMPNFIVRMGHTTATNVSSWISTGLTQVWNAASYQPTATGWNMLNLSNPFEWNGTDNIVIDTAFGLIGNYTSSGTVQYTTVTSGYRYGRSDSVDQSNLFTGTSTSSSRPNVKFILQPNTTGASIHISSNTQYNALMPGEDGTDSFTISNTGDQALSFTINIDELRARNESTLGTASSRDRSILGSTLVLDTSAYLPGTTVDWNFTVTNASTDSEWLEDVIISFPSDVTVNSVTNFVGGDGGDLVADITSGNGVTITWHGEDSSGWGLIQGNGDSASATVNVTIGSGLSGDMTLDWTLNGDVYNSEPHTLSGSIELAEDEAPIEWISVQPLSGTIPSGGSAVITTYFSAANMLPGTYEAILTIQSNDPVNPILEVNASMDVNGTINHPPTLELPVSMDFDKNSSLLLNFSSFASDPDDDPLILQASGNSNINVDINGLFATLTAAQNWTGSETISFNVSDGQLSASDAMTITVNPVAGPDWTVQTYPNNSATIYGVVTINDAPCQLNDVVGVFVGTECRGKAEVTTNASYAYVSLLANLASQGETISFKVWEYDTQITYPVEATYVVNFGQVLGNPTPIPINGVDYLGPDSTIDPLTIAFGEVLVGTQSVQQFSISNSGDRPLIGQITTPPAYSVSSTDRISGDLAVRRSGKAARNSLPYSVDPGTSASFSLSFSPTAVERYEGNVVVTGNDPDAPETHISVSGSGFTHPAIVVDVEEIEVNLAWGTTDQRMFSIANSGSQILEFDIEGSGSVDWLNLDTTEGAVSDTAQVITLDFIAGSLAPGTYQIILHISSNDPDQALLFIPIRMIITNEDPIIALPAACSFPMIETLVMDFSPYVSDVNGQDLALSCSGNVNIGVSIDGLSVSFSSLNQWCGSENITFTVSDGYATASSDMVVTIEPMVLETPILNPITILYPDNGLSLSWQPVQYASLYEVWRSLSSPDSGFELIGTTTEPSFVDPMPYYKAFYMIKALNNPIAKGDAE